MATKIVSASHLKVGSYVNVDGAACKVQSIQVSRPGKHGHAKLRLEVVGIIDGKKRITVMPGHDNVEVPIIEKKSAQVLSIQGTQANVMDAETYETFDLEIPAELQGQVVEGGEILYWVVLSDRVMKQVKGAE